MWDFNCSGNLVKVIDLFYQCSLDDYGGVYINFIVVLYVYVLLVDGGQYNGFMINGIGLSKVVYLFWYVQVYYFSCIFDFVVLVDVFMVVYLDLCEFFFFELIIEEIELIIYQQFNLVDSLSLQQVIVVVELRLLLDCDSFLSVLQFGVFEICLVNDEVFIFFFSEDFEVGINGWIFSVYLEDFGSWVFCYWVLKMMLLEDWFGMVIYVVNLVVGYCDILFNNGLLCLKIFFI